MFELEKFYRYASVPLNFAAPDSAAHCHDEDAVGFVGIDLNFLSLFELRRIASFKFAEGVELNIQFAVN